MSDYPPLFERTTGGAPWSTGTRAGRAAARAAGGFYYALDIADPPKPSFLWRKSPRTARATALREEPPTPAITIVAITEGGVRTPVPVAKSSTMDKVITDRDFGTLGYSAYIFNQPTGNIKQDVSCGIDQEERNEKRFV